MPDIIITNPPPIVVQIKGGKTTAISSPTGSATRLVQLTDVSTAKLANGYVLTYSSANARFEFGPQTGTGGGGDATVIAAQLSSNVNQFPANTLPAAITYDTQDLLVNIGHTVGDSKVYATSNGLYLIVTGVQVGRTIGGGEGPRAYDYWLRQNGVDVPNSTVRAGLRDVSDTIVLVDNFSLQLVTGDYVEVIQAVEQAGLGMGAYRLSALANGPTVPSIIFTMLKVASGANATPNVFSTINVAGQSNIVADSNNDTLTFVAGAGIVITTDAPNDTITFVSTGSSDQFARDQANAAYNQANTANTTGQAAFDKANTANVTGQAAFNQANTDFIIATSAYSQANIATTNADAAFARANAVYANANTAIYTAAQIRANISNTAPINYDPSTGVISHALSGATASGYGDAATVPKVVVDDKGHVTSVTNTTITISAAAITSGTLTVGRGGTGQTAITVNGSLLIGNTVSGGFDVNSLTQGTGIVITNDKGSITIAATGGSAIDQYARDHANAGFNQANTANVTGQAAFDKANSGFTLATTANTVAASAYSQANIATANADAAFTRANAAYANANTAIYTAIQIRANISNTAPINYDATTGVISHATSGATVSGYGDAATVPKVVVDDKGHITSVVNTAIVVSAAAITSGILSVARGGTGKDATGLANGQLLIGNTVNSGFDLTTIAQTAPVIVTNGKGTITLSHASSGVVATGYGTAAQIPVFVVDAFGHLTSVTNTSIAGLDAGVITTGTLVVARGGTGQSSYTNGQILIGNTGSTGLDKATIAQSAPVIVTNLQGSITISHARSGVVAVDSYGSSAIIPVFAVDANGHITAAVNTAVAISAAAITSGTLAVARGGTGQTAVTVNGSLLIGNTVSGGFDVNPLTQGSGILITNDMGSITIAATGGAAANSFGVIAVAGQSNVVAHQANDLFNLAQGTGIVITTDVGTNTITITATGGSAIDQYARDKANGAAQNSFVTLNVAGQSDIVADSNTDTLTIVGSGITITTNAGTDTLTIQHPSSGVVASGHGDAATVPKFIVDANGHVTSVTNTSIAIDAAAVISGTLVVARGGTGQSSYTNGQILIGNTVSGGLDKNTIAQSAPVIVTNDKGTITLSHARSGVVAAVYGNTSIVPSITVDANGHITEAVNTTITIGVAAITSGATANGQTLIGNTVSGAFDVNLIAQTAPVIVTNGKGTITLSHASSGVVATGYGTAAQIPVFVVDAFGHLTTVTNTAITGLDAGVITTGTLVVARGGTGQSSYTNGQILIGNTGSTGLDKSTIAQTTPIIVTNTQGLINLSHATTAVVAGTYGGANRVIGYTVDAFGHLTTASNVAIDQLPASALTSGILSVARGGTGKDATGLANGQLLIGNTVNSGFDLAMIAQTAPVIVVNDKGAITLSHASSGVTPATLAGSNRVLGFTVDGHGHLTATSNVAIADLPASAITTGVLIQAQGGTGFSGATANGQLLIGNTVSGGFDRAPIAQTAPVIVTDLKGSITLSHASSGVTPATLSGSNRVLGYTVDTHGHLTATSNVAIDLLDASVITAGTLTVTRGGTGQGSYTNGQILIGNTGSTGLDKATIAQSAPVIVTNLQGSITISHARSGVVALDSYGSASIIPVLAIDANGHITAAVNTTIAIPASAVTSGILSVARGGTGKDATGLANGQLLIGNTVNAGFDLATIAQTAPVIVVNDKGTITLSHASSGVVASGYGTAAQIPVFVVDAFGHVTSVTNTAIAGLDAGVITTGTLVQGRGGTGFAGSSANGQTLIGNTVSGGFDLATLTAGSGITINNLKGSIEIVATGGSSTDQFARDTANGAFTKANGAVQTGFVTIVVAGQSDVVADSNTDTLTLVAGTNMTITTNAGTDTITLAAAGGGGGGVSLGLVVAASRGYAMP